VVKNSILKIGPDYIYIIGEILEANHINGKILYISDQIVDNMYGDIVCSQLKRFGDVEIQIINQDTISFAMCVAEYVITSDIDCIVGLGGGKVLDVCKYAAYISKRTLISIPTTIANDGIASPIAVLKRKDEKPKSIGCAVPNIIILDINLILNSPKQLIMAGIGDTISNYMALLDWEFACQKKKDEMNGYAYMMSKASLDSLLRTQYTSICPEFVKVLADSLILSGIAMDYAGSSRPVSGSEHLFSHALDYYSERKNLHGIL
jgi:Glycerol dehydrogenase and related enzymes